MFFFEKIKERKAIGIKTDKYIEYAADQLFIYFSQLLNALTEEEHKLHYRQELNGELLEGEDADKLLKAEEKLKHLKLNINIETANIFANFIATSTADWE